MNKSVFVNLSMPRMRLGSLQARRSASSCAERDSTAMSASKILPTTKPVDGFLTSRSSNSRSRNSSRPIVEVSCQASLQAHQWRFERPVVSKHDCQQHRKVELHHMEYSYSGFSGDRRTLAVAAAAGLEWLCASRSQSATSVDRMFAQ